MSYNSKHSIPAFGGLASSNDLCSYNDAPNLNLLMQGDSVRLYTNLSQNNNAENYYKLENNNFLWTGGFKTKHKKSLSEFNCEQCEHKFIFIHINNSKLELFTDHFSKIPLFYSLVNNVLFFATSLDVLLELKGSQKVKVDKNGLLFYYNYGFSNYKDFLLENIGSVPGGQHLNFSLERNALKQNTYYNIFRVDRYKNNSNSLQENIQAIDEELLKSTRDTVENFNTIGIALSGGVDSGYLAQKINEAGRDFNAYTLGFKNDYNEFDRIDYLSERLNFRAKKIIIDSEDIISNYIEVCKVSSFPVGFNNSILNIIYKHAKGDGVDLMFDGDGADRLFLGMNKYLQLKKILKLYGASKTLKINGLLAKLLSIIKHPSSSKLAFYFKRFNENYPFYGERKLSHVRLYISEFESLLNDLALPEGLKRLSTTIDSWLFFSLFSVYYTPAFFFHTPYELQLQHNIVSNPQFWSDHMVDLALSIPTEQKLYHKKTKMVLREAAKLKIDDGYWNLSKIGLQNSYEYIKQSKVGKDFIDSICQDIRKSEDYLHLQEISPEKDINPERLLPYHIWKENLKGSN